MPRLGQEWVSTRQARVTPTAADLHWAAGFIEGEGTFGFRAVTAAIHVAQTGNLAPLRKLLRMFGGSITLHSAESSRRRGLRARDGAMWTVRGARARGVMMTLYSLLSPKRRRQVRAALQHTPTTSFEELPRLVPVTDKQREEIRVKYKNRERGSVLRLAMKFGISRQQVWRIANPHK